MFALKCEHSRLTFHKILFYIETLLWLWVLFAFATLTECIFYQAGHREHWLQNRSFDSSLSPRRALLPQPLLHDYTHICCPDATQPPPPPPHPCPPSLHRTSLLQLPRSTCGCCSSTLFINSFLMLPDGMTVIYGGLSVFYVCVYLSGCVWVGVFIHKIYA